MKVILTQDIKGLGKAEDIVDVKRGYANNYLLPQGLALESTPNNMNVVKQRRKAEAAKAEKLLAEAKELAAKLSGEAFELKIKCGEGGRLYGAITTADLAEALLAKGHEVDKRNITINDTIKELGEYDADIKLHPEVSVSVKLQVVELD